MSLFNYLQNIYWREPLWLLLFLQPIAILMLKRVIGKNSLSHYAEKKLQPWLIIPTQTKLINQLFSKNSAYLLAWILFAIALAGPRLPVQQAGKEQHFAANIMLVVDISQSMQATDILPNRIQRAKIEIHELLDKAPQHRMGITVFAARPHLFVPMTSDYAALSTYLDSLDSLVSPTLGSDPLAAILLAKKELNRINGKSAIVLITDGDFASFSTKRTESALEELKQTDIPLYILGVGTVEGEAIPLKDGSWLKYKEQAVISRMNEVFLQQLAKQFNGKFSPVHDGGEDWQSLYDDGLKYHHTGNIIENETNILWHELFPGFLLVSLLLFWLALSPYQLKLNKNISVITLVFIFFSLAPEKEALAFGIGKTTEQHAYEAYINQEYAKSAELYKSISSKLKNRYQGHIGQGNSLYKLGHYQEAIQQFTLAIINADSDKQRAIALYNLGNSYFHSGVFSSAITAYQDSLRYQQENQAAVHNLQISRVLKETLEKRLSEKEQIKKTRRQGRGPDSANIADGSEINNNTSVSVGGSESKLTNAIPLPDVPDINKDTLKKLLSIGLEYIKLADQENATQQATRQDSGQNRNLDHSQDLIRAQQHLSSMTESQHLLWKRLFEIEEGFPAPVDTPKVLPGVNPW